MRRVATVRDFHISASSCFEGAPSPYPRPSSLHHTSIPTSPFARASALGPIAIPLLVNFPPTLSPQAGILKAGAAGVELPLKAKHALAQVMMGAASAQRFPFLD